MVAASVPCPIDGTLNQYQLGSVNKSEFANELAFVQLHPIRLEIKRGGLTGFELSFLLFLEQAYDELYGLRDTRLVGDPHLV